jgi:hypothetical protein
LRSFSNVGISSESEDNNSNTLLEHSSDPLPPSEWNFPLQDLGDEDYQNSDELLILGTERFS